MISGGTAQRTPEQLSALRGGTPAKLARRLRGELDNIVMMALRKEPERRYGSVEHLGEDFGRHMSGLPVRAQPDTVVYRTRKFVYRHRVGVAAAAMVLISMVVAVTSTAWQARIARAERGRAESQATEAEFHRARAERGAQFAREQLRIVEQRTREAEARRVEASVERERAERRARDVQAIAASLLDVNANVVDSPGAIEAGKRAATDAERILLTLGLEGFAAPSLAKDVVALQGLIRKYEALDASVTRTSPAGWLFYSEHRKDYEFGIDRSNSVTGASAYIKSRRAQAQGSAELFQAIDVESYRGKRLRVSAMLKSSRVEDAAGITVQVADEDGLPVFDIMRQLKLRGTNGWSRQAFVFDVPENGSEVTIGFALKGSGAVWADDFSLEEVDSSVPVTATQPKAPNNLSFEEPN